MTSKTWKDVDEVVKMKFGSKDISLQDLETAIASDDDVRLKDLVNAMRGEDKRYTADVYPFEGIKLTFEMQIRRCRSWFNEGELVHHIYTQAKSRDKKSKESEEKKRIEKEKDAEIERLKREVEETKKAEAEARKIAEDKAAKDAKAFAEAGFKGKKVAVKVEEVGTDSEPEEIDNSKSAIPVCDQIKFDVMKSDSAHSGFVPDIDNMYEFPEWTVEFVNLLDKGMNVWLYGGTGAGKSSLAEQVCAIGKLPLIYQSFHEDIKPDALFGGFRLEDGNTVWQDGPVTKAYREGLVLLLDEVDGTPPEILFCLYAILDRKPLVLADNGCEVVKCHPNFRVVATGNTLGRGDESGSYSGTNVLNRAFLNRFRIWYQVNYPSENVYKKIIMKEGITEAVAAVVARLAREINTAAMNGTLTETFSLRDAREVSKAAEILGGDVKRALQLTLLNRLSTVEQAAINDVYKRLVPGA